MYIQIFIIKDKMKTEYKRNCPSCCKELSYGSNTSFNLAKRKNANCRNCSTKKYAKRKGDLSFLMDEDNVSYYWIGFILADGSIDKNKRLKIVLSKKDEDHLKVFSNKVGITTRDVTSKLKNVEYPQSSVSILHSDIILKVIKKFDIKQNKTLNPPNINFYENFKKEFLLSLFVGFIDGDGSIGKKHKREDYQIRIKIHKNWMEFLRFFNETLEINSPLKITKTGHTLLDISNFKTCKFLKREMLKLGVPFLRRKWDQIQIDNKYDT